MLVPRPLHVLLASLLPVAAGVAQQASHLRLAHRDGQTFVVWSEGQSSAPPDAYHVYRSANPIVRPSDLSFAQLVARVDKGSYWNTRAGAPFVLERGKPALAAGEGFVVITADKVQPAHYAVLAVTGSAEDRSITTGPTGNAQGPITEFVAMPKPVLQSIRASGLDHHYVHFAPGVDTSFGKAMTNRRGRAWNFRIYYDPTTMAPRPIVLYLHARNGDFHSPVAFGWTPDNAIHLFVDDENAPSVHSVWFGHHEDHGNGPPSRSVQDYTERRILWTIDWLLGEKTFGADANRVYCLGVSLGAMGAFALGLRHPDRFAATAGIVPAFALTHSDFALTAEIATLFGTPSQNLTTSLTERVYDLFDYRKQVAKASVAGTAPMFFTAGRADAVTGWTEKPDFFRAAFAARQPIRFYWDYRAHATQGPWSDLEDDLFRELCEIHLDRPLPAFTNLSLDDDPGDGDRYRGALVGAMGGYVSFNASTATEDASRVVLDVSLRRDSSRIDYARQAYATVDMTWRRLSAFKVQPGNFYRMRSHRKSWTRIEEERIVAPDENGVLTLRSMHVEHPVRTVELEAYTPSLPEMHLGGASYLGGTFAVSVLATPKDPVLVVFGTTAGKIPTPFGTLEILDPNPVMSGVVPANGHLEAVVPLPNHPGIRGEILGQALVGLKLTNLARLTIR